MFEKEMPERLGISSKDIMDYIKILEKNNNCMHSFILMRKDKLLAEGYWKPFKKDELHRMYSVSKTFVSTAIGILYGEGKISLDDKILKFFPEYDEGEKTHKYIRDMSIRDLLMMATPFDDQTYCGKDMNWIETFFKTKPTHPSGTIYHYDTSGTYILNIIVERITGKPFMEYLREKLFLHIGFSENAWCIKGPEETNSWGGSGVMASTRDMVRLASVFMHNGKYNGVQLIPEDYVKEATKAQIDNNSDGTNNIYCNGYGYQIWILPNGGYSFIGMGNQDVIILPKEEIIFACTADGQGSLGHRVIIYEYFYSKIVENLKNELLEDNNAYNELQKMCDGLFVKPLYNKCETNVLNKINNVTYKLYENQMKIDEINVSINCKDGELNYSTPRGKKIIKFKMNEYMIDKFPETHYSGDTINKSIEREYRCMSCGVWTQENKLVIRTYIIDDYFGNLTTTLSFKNDEIGIEMFKTAEWFLDEYNGFAGGYAIK